MKKKLLITLLAIIATLCCVFGLTACDDDNGSVDSINGTYYYYKDGETDKTRYITLNNGQWRNPDNSGGTYEIKGTEIIFYVYVYNTNVAMWKGTCSDGKLANIAGVGAPATYFKDGFAPSTSGGGNTEHTHSYTQTEIAPTCKELGYTSHICKCGEEYEDNYVDALGHNYENHVCTRCGEIDPNAP